MDVSENKKNMIKVQTFRCRYPTEADQRECYLLLVVHISSSFLQLSLTWTTSSHPGRGRLH